MVKENYHPLSLALCVCVLIGADGGQDENRNKIKTLWNTFFVTK